jgi:response regulator RpfG family c-di-GMP phosphodiesterase
MIPSSKIEYVAAAVAEGYAVQAATLKGERFLVVDDEPLIAMDVQATLEGEGATVLVASTIPDALRYADYPALSGGVLDVRVGEDDAEPICEALNRRAVPFIFFTGVSVPLSERWRMTPLVSKPAKPEKIVGALKFVISPDAREIIVASQSRAGDIERISRIDHVIRQGEERIARMRRGIDWLAKSGADTSAATQVVATTVELIEGMRKHKEISLQLASKLGR